MLRKNGENLICFLQWVDEGVVHPLYMKDNRKILLALFEIFSFLEIVMSSIRSNRRKLKNGGRKVVEVKEWEKIGISRTAYFRNKSNKVY